MIATDGAGWRHPLVLLGVACETRLITEMSLSTSFAVYRVCVWRVEDDLSGSGPAWMVGGLSAAHAARWRPVAFVGVDHDQ